MKSSVAFAFLLVVPVFGACASASESAATDARVAGEDGGDGKTGRDGEASAVDDASALDASKRDGRTPDDASKIDDAKNDGSSATCGALRADCDQKGSCETDLFTNEDHCGACGNECAFMSTCVAGTCQAPLDRDLIRSDGRFLVADNQRAYWLASEALPDGGYTWTVRSMAHSAASPSTLYKSGGPIPEDLSLAESGADLYIAVYGTSGGSIHRLPKTGGGLTLVAQDDEGSVVGNVEPGVGVSGGYVFWIARNGIYRFGGSGPAALWTKTFCARDLLVENGEVYWSCYQGYIAHRSATAAPTTTGPFPNFSGGPEFAVDGSNIYTVGTGGIESQPLSGGAKSLRVAGALGAELETDGSNVYWSGSTGASTMGVFEGSLAGGTPRALWNASAQITSIALGGQWVYFATNAIDLHRAPK